MMFISFFDEIKVVKNDLMLEDVEVREVEKSLL